MDKSDSLRRLAAENPFPATRIGTPEDLGIDVEIARLKTRSSTHEAHAVRLRPPRAARRRLFVAIAAAAVLAAPSWAARDRITNIFGLSSSGHVVTPTRGAYDELGALGQGGFDADIKLLSQRSGVRFYVGHSALHDGPCYAVALASAPSPHVGVLTCQVADAPSGSGVFPSREMPIRDFSPQRVSPDRRNVVVTRLIGFAADAVASVGVVSDNGHIHEVPVHANTYVSEDLPQEPAAAIIAKDSSGKTIYEHVLGASARKSKR